MKLIITFILLISTFNLLAQKDKCNCLENLKVLKSKTEENYAGFPAKVNNKTQNSYNQLTQKLLKNAATVDDPKTCFYLLKEYVRYFKDKHFVLKYYNENDFDTKKVVYDDKYFKNAISKNNLTAIEGIWINTDTTLRIAIQKISNTTYNGIVIESKLKGIPKGLIYLTLIKQKKIYRIKEYNSFITTDVPAKQIGNLLRIWNHDLFGKIYPNKMTESEQEELNSWKNNNNGLFFKKLSAQTAYLRIPSFINNDDKIQQLVAVSDSIIKNTPYLILDLTANGGGNAGWVSVLPYFMTNPIIQYETYLRVTPDNVKSKIADLEPFVVNPIPVEYQKYFPNEVLEKYKTAYKELHTTQKTFYPIPSVSFPLDSVLKYPLKIAVIVDDFCGSSAEYFFSLLKQSKKAVTYGIPTIGMMDYEGMSNPTPMPYEKYILTIPITKSSWTDNKPIDQTGFKPTKVLNNIPQKGWINYIQNDLQKN